jgi:hypothetical protein
LLQAESSRYRRPAQTPARASARRHRQSRGDLRRNKDDNGNGDGGQIESILYPLSSYRAVRVVTRDGKAGVQTGELVVITESGIERMHSVPRGFVAI